VDGPPAFDDVAPLRRSAAALPPSVTVHIVALTGSGPSPASAMELRRCSEAYGAIARRSGGSYSAVSLCSSSRPFRSGPFFSSLLNPLCNAHLLPSSLPASMLMLEQVRLPEDAGVYKRAFALIGQRWAPLPSPLLRHYLPPPLLPPLLPHPIISSASSTLPSL
jgi:hypothetical protein